VHQNKFANLNKTVPTDPLKVIAFFEQSHATDKVAGVLEKIAKDKQPKERKMAQLPVTRSCESSYCLVNIPTTVKSTNVTAMIDNLTIVIKTICATIALNRTTRT
jgi:hypothetical protein